MIGLAVWRSGRRVGLLDFAPNTEVRFTYDPDVAAQRRPEDAVALNCPVREKSYVGTVPASVFENLLPEGNLRGSLGQATKHDVSDTVGLLGVVGGECAGALQLWPDGVPLPTAFEYDDVSGTSLEAAFSGANGQIRQARGRASLSGMQPKLVLLRQPTVGGDRPRYQLPRNGAPTTVVVKRPGVGHAGLLEAEMVGMRLMKAAEVDTASSARCHVAMECHESERFDRFVNPEGVVERRHALDGCQMTGRLSRNKYAQDGGPTFLELCAVLKRASLNALEDREMLFRWAVANAAIGNHDGHAKNISVVYVGPDRVRLAKAYDVVVTTIFGYPREFSIHFCGTTNPKAVTPEGLRAAAREFDLGPKRVQDMANQVIQRVREGLSAALQEVSEAGGDADVLAKLDVEVESTSSDLATRLGFSVP